MGFCRKVRPPAQRLLPAPSVFRLSACRDRQAGRLCREETGLREDGGAEFRRRRDHASGLGRESGPEACPRAALAHAAVTRVALRGVAPQNACRPGCRMTRYSHYCSLCAQCHTYLLFIDIEGTVNLMNALNYPTISLRERTRDTVTFYKSIDFEGVGFN